MTARVVGWVAPKGRVEVVVDALVRLGATPDNDVVIPVVGVSRTHAKIVKQSDGYYLEDANSRNGTWVNGERVTRQMLRHLDVITLGRYADVLFVTSASDAGARPRAGIAAALEWLDGEERGRRMLLPRGEFLVGRAPSCRIVIDDAAVSRAHARFIVTGSTVTLEDLGSINGTFVGTERIGRPVTLASGTVVGFGEPGGCRVLIRGTPSEVSSTSYVSPPSPDMEWMTRIVWTSEDLEDESPGGITPPPARAETAPIPADALPPPAITADAARASGDATQLRAPATLFVERLPLAAPPLQDTDEARAGATKAETFEGRQAEPPGPETVMVRPIADIPAFEAGSDAGTPSATIVGDRSLAPPVFASGEASDAAAQTDDVPEMPHLAPRQLARGGSELPAETVLGFSEAGPPPRALTTMPPTPRVADGPQDGARAGAMPPLERNGNIERRAARSRIQAITLTGEAGTFVLTKGTATVGRSALATVRIDSQDVSRIHAVLVITDDTVTIEDRGSVNGTAVNGAMISSARPLQAGDRVSFADFEFRVDLQRSDDTP